MARNTLIALLFAAFAATPVHAAKLYKWVDEYGNISYQDRPPPEGQGRVEEKTVREGRGAVAADPASAEAAAKFPVRLYMVPNCSPCDAARAFLKKRGVPFSETNVSEKNPQAQEEMRKKVGDLSVPTITVGGKVMKGFMESLLEGELDQAGYPKAPEKPEGEGAEGTTPAQ
jgi:glutaredoxin